MNKKGNSIGPSSVHSDAYSQKQHVIKDNGTFRLEDQFSVETKVMEAVQDHDSRECNVNMSELTDETKSRDVLSKISTSNMLDGNKLSESKCVAPDGEKDSMLLALEHDTAKLSYNEFQEPGESSQANALGFVDHYLLLNNMNLSEEVAPTKTSRQKSPPVFCAKGPQSMARRAILGTTFGMSGTFEWDDSQIPDGEGELLKKREDFILNGEGSEPRSVTRPQSARNQNVQRQRNLGVRCKEKLQGKMMGADFSDSSSIVDNSEVGEVVQVSEMKFVKEIDAQLNAETSGQQLEAGGVGREIPDIFDVGFDTQMAAETMESLLYAPLPNSNVDYVHQDSENMIEDSSKGATGKCSFSTRVCSNSGITARKLKQTNRPSKKLSVKLSGSYPKSTKNKLELGPKLPEAYKVKRGKSLAEKPFNSGKSTNAKKHSCGSSFKLIEQGKEDEALERGNIKVQDENLISSISVKHNSLGEGPMEGKCTNFSPIAYRTRRWSSVYMLKETEDPINSCGKRKTDVMEVGVPKKRRKNGKNADMLQVAGVREKSPKIGLHVSEEATNIEVGQQAQTELDVAPAGSHLKLDVWSYPTGKRKHRNVPCHSKEVSDICLPSTLVEGEKGNRFSVESHKKSKGNSETSCFSLDVRRKPRSRVYAHQVQPSLVKIREENFLRHNSDERNSTNVVHCGAAVMNKNTTPLDPDRVKASGQSGELDSIDFISSADGANENIKCGILSNGNPKASLLKCPSPLKFTKSLDLAPAISKGYDNCKQLCNRKLSRFPLMKELISLGIDGLVPNTASKDLRRRRDMANVRVLFSQNLDHDIIKQQKKILTRLRSSIASCCSDATHFIADRFVRTRNMLEAIALGKPVVTHLWLDSCGQASCFIDEKNYILRDAKKEKEIGFGMPVSLAHARQHPLLKGRRVFITPNIKPSKELIVSLVKAVDGQAVDKIQNAAMKNEMIPDELLILSCEQDYALCAPFLHRGAAVYSSELLLNGIIIQKLEFERHQLFKNLSQESLMSHRSEERW